MKNVGTERANIKTQIVIKRFFTHFSAVSHVFRLNRRDKFMFHSVDICSMLGDFVFRSF